MKLPLICVLALLPCGGSAARNSHVAAVQEQRQAAVVSQGRNGTERGSGSSVSYDDLGWLVGRWRCYARTYLVRVELPLGSHAEDSLEYLNVYYPFADEHLTLELSRDPKGRQIAAEFLVRTVAPWPPFTERLEPMAPRGPVFIGKDRIWIEESPFEVLEFRYHLEKRGHSSWLILESKNLRLELLKLNIALGDVADAAVFAPIKGYSHEKRLDLEKKYGALKEAVTKSADAGQRPDIK